MTEAADKPRRSTLVMFSSGVDSTWTLMKLLRDTGDEIFAHHIHFINNEGRHRAEADSIRNLVAELREIRPFHYSETTLDRRNMRWFGFDVMSVGFEAGICAHSFFEARGRGMDRWTIGTCIEEGHNEERFAHAEACMRANCYPGPAPEFFLLPMVTKAQEVADLGPKLTDLCWTCRRPVKDGDNWLPCGICQTCKLMETAR